METKKVRNKGSQAQFVVYKGAKVNLGGYEDKVFDAEIADLFLVNYPEFVVKSDDNFGAAVDGTGRDKGQWIANMTGNPEAPLKIRVKKWKNGDKTWIEEDMDNDVKHPRDLTEHAAGSQVEYTTNTGLYAETLPGVDITVPAYKRVYLDTPVASWFMDLVSTATTRVVPGTYQPIRAMVSRAPSHFEPDMTWPLDEIVAYFTLTDPNVKITDTELSIRNKNKRANTAEVNFKIDEVKRALLRRLYFRLVDPRFKLPTKQELRDYLGDTKNTKEPEEVEDIIAKSNKEVEQTIEA